MKSDIEAPRLATGFRAALGAFALVYGVGLALALAAPLLAERRAWLSQAVHAALHAPSGAALLRAGIDAADYLAAVMIQPFTVIAVFMLVEIRLSGAPADWRATGRGLLFRSVMTVFHAASALAVAKLLALALPVPLVRVSALCGLPAPWATLSSAGVALLYMVAHDFGYYWAHRAMHRVPLLWRFHRVHHSVDNLDAAGSFAHPLDNAAPLLVIGTIGAVIGFDYQDFLLIGAVRVIHEVFIHSRAPLHLGPLRAVLVDNRYHRRHHSRRADHYNQNFAEYFTLWDRVFGTCHVPGDEMVRTGIPGTRPPRTLRGYLLGRVEERGEGPRG